LRRDGLAGALTFDTFRPEIGRYSIGAADPAAAMDAVQAVWAADSATATALLDAAQPDPALDLDAATAASMLDLLSAGLGRDDALVWLINHRELTGTAPISNRDTVIAARSLWLEPPSRLQQVWARRAAALSAYRGQLSGLPDTVLVSLLHLHHVRIHQPDPAGEQARHRIARAVALAARAPKGRA
jgi:thiopeptide-type bacteriocin biosynthesis protein